MLKIKKSPVAASYFIQDESAILIDFDTQKDASPDYRIRYTLIALVHEFVHYLQHKMGHDFNRFDLYERYKVELQAHEVSCFLARLLRVDHYYEGGAEEGAISSLASCISQIKADCAFPC